VAASSGNHGNAVAYGARVLGCSARIFVPEQAAPGKVAAIRSQGAEVQRQGPDCVETEAFARAFAQEHGLAYLSPYNDPQVVAGQGTCALELLRQAGPLDALIVALGGGGLIGGMGSVLKDAHPDAKVIACSPERSPAMHVCLEAGRIVDVPCGPTLSDGTAGGVEAGSLTFPLCQEVVDRSLLVSEEELREATCAFITTHHMLIEGAAGVALAGYARLAEELAGQRVGVVICGANIGLESLREVIR
jgi:threonine dehydratase